MKFNKIIALLLAGALCLSSVGCGKNKADISQTENSQSSSEAQSEDSYVCVMGNTSSNIANLGGVCQYEDKLYYQNAEDNFSIYCSDLDGSNPVKLNDAESYFINVNPDGIFYVNGTDNFKIYRMDMDGSNQTKLNENSSYYLTTCDDKLFYSNYDDGNKIYWLSMDGSSNKLICEDQAQYVTVKQDRIYYSNWSDGGKLYSIDYFGENKVKLSETGAWYPVVYGDWIYYSAWKKVGNEQREDDPDDKFINRVKLNGAVNEELNNVPSGDINVYNDRVYYTNWLDNKIYSMALDGSDNKVVSEEYGIYITTAADKLYYVDKKDSNISIKSIDIKGDK